MTNVFLCDGVRTPIGCYGGALSSVRPDDLAAHVLRDVMARNPGLSPDQVDDVVLGCANQAGEDNSNVARMSALLAGLPESVPGLTVNRLCGSGLDAVATAHAMIRAGQADVIIAGGVESMSRAPIVVPKAETAFARRAEAFDTTIGWRFVNRKMHSRYGIDTGAQAAENVAEAFDVTRAAQDAFAKRSHDRAMAAHQAGRFAREISPVDIACAKTSAQMVSHDEGLRAFTTAELSAMATMTHDQGTVTAGNSSGLNDGAAAIILASESAVARFALTPHARLTGSAVAGVVPRLMGVGMVPAVEKLFARLKVTLGDVDLFELNEAFASQTLAVIRRLGLADDADHVNPNGGAIALGHPLGMSGARLALTTALEMADTGASRGLCAMSVGAGQGIAVMLEAA